MAEKVRYEDGQKFAYFNGIKFTRDNKTGYYLNSTIRKRLHRYIWEFYNGKAPKGHHVHHKDRDKSNNDISNLGLLRHGKHVTLHGIENSMDDEWLERSRENLKVNARPKASEWHRSEEGKEWHKQHYESCKDKFHRKVKRNCDNCGAEFEALDNGLNRFCSNKCKSAWRRATGLDDEVKQCEFCGTVFIANKYSKQKCCSKACSNRLSPRLPILRKGKVS